jgi:hypothetical protein
VERKYLAIKNLEKYQTYKDGRRVLWLKWYPQILDDEDFAHLDDDSKLLFPYLLILAARTNNLIPDKISWVLGIG